MEAWLTAEDGEGSTEAVGELVGGCVEEASTYVVAISVATDDTNTTSDDEPVSAAADDVGFVLGSEEFVFGDFALASAAGVQDAVARSNTRWTTDISAPLALKD